MKRGRDGWMDEWRKGGREEARVALLYIPPTSWLFIINITSPIHRVQVSHSCRHLLDILAGSLLRDRGYKEEERAIYRRVGEKWVWSPLPALLQSPLSRW